VGAGFAVLGLVLGVLLGRVLDRNDQLRRISVSSVLRTLFMECLRRTTTTMQGEGDGSTKLEIYVAAGSFAGSSASRRSVSVDQGASIQIEVSAITAAVARLSTRDDAGDAMTLTRSRICRARRRPNARNCPEFFASAEFPTALHDPFPPWSGRWTYSRKAGMPLGP
jgi:hypothetical protein